MEYSTVSDPPTSSVRLNNPNLNSLSVLFTEAKLNEMARSLDRYYALLKTLMTTPAVIHHDELVLLRRRAAQPDLGTTILAGSQAQLRLAVELLRLGRRAEGFALLNQIEERLPISASAEENESSILAYGLWLALLRASVGNTNAAHDLGHRLASASPDKATAEAIRSFFRKMNQTMQ